MGMTEKENLFYYDGSHSSPKKERNHLGDGFDVKNLIIKLGMNLDKKELYDLSPILMKAVIRESDSDKLKIIC